MKLNGRKLAGPNTEVLVIPREDGEDLIFKAQAVVSFDEFDTIYPRPEPPKIQRRGETEATPDYTDKGYKEAIEKWSTARSNWLILKSISATPGLEWETVDMTKPETWANYITELDGTGLSQTERGRVMALIVSANGMDEAKYKEARNRFLQSQVTAV